MSASSEDKEIFLRNVRNLSPDIADALEQTMGPGMESMTNRERGILFGGVITGLVVAYSMEDSEIELVLSKWEKKIDKQLAKNAADKPIQEADHGKR